jgi:ABC-type amino acid transport substrate-binding protein
MSKKSWAIQILHNNCAVLIFLFLISLTESPRAEEVIRYARQENLTDKRDMYPVQLLKLVLQKAGNKNTVEPAAYFMPQGRALQELERGSYIDVAWTMTSTEREEHLLPVRICIYKGLMGWRIPIVTKSNENLLSNVKSLADLKQLFAGQGYDWPDTAILRNAGLKVEVGNQYESLFKMLQANRFDYLPLSLIEVWDAGDKYAYANLIIDEHLLLRYQVGFYYFVNRNNPELAETIRRGLELAIKDGSFDALFYQYFGEAIHRAQLNKRTLIDIDNGLLPLNTPINRKELWFRRENDPTSKK